MKNVSVKMGPVQSITFFRKTAKLPSSNCRGETLIAILKFLLSELRLALGIGLGPGQG